MKKIAYTTDSHLDEQFPKEKGVDARQNWQRILDDVASKSINNIIFGGDIGEYTSNKWFFDSLADFKFNITLGNHDTFAEVIKHYKLASWVSTDELYYAFEDEFFKHIYLDSSTEKISATQFDWFKKALVTTKKILLFVHHPILKINTVVDERYPLKGREKIKSALHKIQNEITLFCGHCHTSDVRTEDNITQIMTTAASYQVEKNLEKIILNTEFFGYTIIEIERDKVNFEPIILKN